MALQKKVEGYGIQQQDEGDEPRLVSRKAPDPLERNGDQGVYKIASRVSEDLLSVWIIEEI